MMQDNDEVLELLKSHLSDAYFTTDLAKITGLPINKVKFLCRKHNLKPSKKVFCIVCGEEIDLSSSKIVKKYCSRKCSNKNNRSITVPEVKYKTCKGCYKPFKVVTNRIYCSDECKNLRSRIRRDIKCLKE